MNASIISRICRRLQDVCSVDLQNRPVTPFGGHGVVVKCDESKFNHKAKVNTSSFSRITLQAPSSLQAPNNETRFFYAVYSDKSHNKICVS